ncbi:MAG: nuclear transport factor 2 family protein [Haliscomenobacter sp.]|uniref:nuclear transport factor 2 family protein n=1 Tax=Haliscomenobacter sp. TaxID=2717303 RepID=UPI0029A3403D|nr:nuclear transport factor 2 family protein [Haliscomenobacter sp.]MDX2068887.1 nuclear transport factor 2 family protein [Haliscomenobacter sp.]
MKVFALHIIWVLQIFCFFSCETKEATKEKSVQQKNDPALAEILALEKMRLDATVQFDSVKLKQLLAPEFEMTTAQGEVLNTQKMLQVLQKKNQTLNPEQHFTRSTKVQFLNDNNFAVVKGVYVIERKESRGLIVLTYRYTDLFIKTPKNAWLLVSSHMSRIAR